MVKISKGWYYKKIEGGKGELITLKNVYTMDAISIAIRYKDGKIINIGYSDNIRWEMLQTNEGIIFHDDENLVKRRINNLVRRGFIPLNKKIIKRLRKKYGINIKYGEEYVIIEQPKYDISFSHFNR